MRIGHGYDVHRLVAGRKLILGGVDIPNDLGLLGHSDADVLLHALSDAILGAIGEGDIGRHFPDTDPAFKGADSIKLLQQVMALADGKGFRIGNVDATEACSLHPTDAAQRRPCPFLRGGAGERQGHHHRGARLRRAR